MKLINKIIPLALLPFVCVSCDVPKDRLLAEDLDAYCFTKWVRDDGCFVFFAEGIKNTLSGFGFFSDDDIRYKVGISSRFSGLRMSVVHDETVLEYTLKKVVENDGWDGTILAIDNASKKEFCFFPKKIDLGEIDLNLFESTNLKNNENAIYFQFLYKSISYQSNVWLWNNDDEQYSLSFGENRTFTIVGSDKFSTGAYIPDYESVKLVFDDDNIFEQNRLVLTYVFGG